MTSTISRLLKLEFMFQIECEMKLGIESFKVSLAQDVAFITGFVLSLSSCNSNSQVVLVVKNLPANAGDRTDVGLIPGLGRSPGVEHGAPLQYSCLEKSH